MSETSFTIKDLKRLYDDMKLSPQALKDALHRCNPDLPTDDWTLGYFRNRIRSKLARLDPPPRRGMPNKYDNCIKRSYKKPHDYQKKVVDFMMMNRGLIVYHKVGAGKTLTAVLVSQCFLLRFPWKQVIVVAPAGLVPNFEKEMTTSYGRLFWPRETSYRLFSYEGLYNAYNRGDIDCRNCLLIIDEGHNLRNMYHKSKTGKETGKMNKVITECAEQADKVLILTGTPLYNSKNDIIALYNMVRNPSTTPRISTPSDFRFDWLRCLISYYNPSSSSGDFPKRKDHTVRLKMTPDYVREYEEAVSIIKGQAEMGADSLVKKIFGGESKSMEAFHNVIRRAINNLEDREYRRGRLSQLPKIMWVLEKIEDVDGFPGPIVVFSHFLEAGNRIIVAELRKRAKMRDIFDCLQNSSTLEILKKRIKKMFPDPLDKDMRHCIYKIWKKVPKEKGKMNNPFPKISFEIIEGSVSPEERMKIVKKYNRGELRVLFISTAGGEGLDLKNTRAVILLEPSWNKATQEQVIGRAIRYKSHEELSKKDRKVDVYTIMLYKPSDKEPFRQILAWLEDSSISFEDKDKRPAVMEPYVLSIDVFLTAYLEKKQQDIDHYDMIVQSHAIENNPECFR